MSRKVDTGIGPGTMRVRQDRLGSTVQAWVRPQPGSCGATGAQNLPTSKPALLTQGEVTAPVAPVVVDDFPALIPVVQRELDIIETYLGVLLDDVLSGAD
jgi:hypothetical protein